MNAQAYQIYADNLTGHHIVLLKATPTKMWLALRIESLSLCFVTPYHVQRLQLIGQAKIK